MPRRHCPKKTRHGATQPEEARRAVQVLLRLPPETRSRLDELAGIWGMTRSATVGRLLEIVDDGDDDASPSG
jgi:hypothetical protein